MNVIFRIPSPESPMTAYLVRIVDPMICVIFQDADRYIPSCCPQKGLGMDGKRFDFFGNGADRVPFLGWTH